MPANPDSLEIVQVDKQESTVLGGDDADVKEWGSTPINPEEDMLEAAGLTLVEAGDVRPIRTRCIWPDGDNLRVKDVNNPGASGEGLTLSQLKSLWQLVSGLLEPLVNGQGIKLYDSTGDQWVTLLRTAGNFAISVGGTGANALYKNTPKEVTQLGGSDQNAYSHVQNSGDAACHTIYGDRTTKLYGNQRHTNAGSATEYMDVGRNGTQGYIQVAGGTETLQLTQKILQARLNGSAVGEYFEVIGDLGPALRVMADLTARFYGLVTHGGHIHPDANNVRDLGSNSARWRSGYFQTEVRLTSGGIGYTKLENGKLSTVNSNLELAGGFGWLAKITDILGDSIFQFVGNASNRKAQVRAFYGTGSGSTYTDLTHDGSDGNILVGSGDLKLLAEERSVVVPTAAVDPATTVDAGIFHNSADHKFRGQLNGTKLDFSMEFPPAATDPTTGMVDGSRYYNTSIKKWMTYDAGRSKWLSEDSVAIQFGRNGDTIAGDYYRGVNGVILSDVIGYPGMWKGTIVALAYTRADSDAATFEVTADGTGIAELASSAAVGSSDALNGDFNKDQVIALRNKTGSNTTSTVQAWITIRWRVPAQPLVLAAVPGQEG